MHPNSTISMMSGADLQMVAPYPSYLLKVTNPHCNHAFESDCDHYDSDCCVHLEDVPQPSTKPIIPTKGWARLVVDDDKYRQPTVFRLKQGRFDLMIDEVEWGIRRKLKNGSMFVLTPDQPQQCDLCASPAYLNLDEYDATIPGKINGLFRGGNGTIVIFRPDRCKSARSVLPSIEHNTASDLIRPPKTPDHSKVSSNKADTRYGLGTKRKKSPSEEDSYEESGDEDDENHEEDEYQPKQKRKPKKRARSLKKVNPPPTPRLLSEAAEEPLSSESGWDSQSDDPSWLLSLI